MKRGSHRLFAALAIAAVAGTVVLALLRDREPEYKGKALSSWAEQYEDSFPPNSFDGDTPEDSAARREAVEAVCRMKEKILPRALNAIAVQKPQWKEEVEHIMEGKLDVRRWCPVWIWEPFYGDPGEDNLVYFEMLGPDANKAVPELVRIMKRADAPRIRERAMYALACIGKEGLPPLMGVIGDVHNPDRLMAAYALLGMKKFGSLAAPAVPLLVKSLNDTDRNVAFAGATMLGKLGLEADVAVPALTNCLQSADGSFREETVEALEKYGAKARSAAPALLRALDDPDDSVRRAVTNALANIAPETLNGEIGYRLAHSQSP